MVLNSGYWRDWSITSRCPWSSVSWAVMLLALKTRNVIGVFGSVYCHSRLLFVKLSVAESVVLSLLVLLDLTLSALSQLRKKHLKLNAHAHFLSLYFSYRCGGKSKYINNQLHSSRVIMSLILVPTMFHNALILHRQFHADHVIMRLKELMIWYLLLCSFSSNRWAPWSESKIVFDYHHQPSLNHLRKQYTLVVPLARYLCYFPCSKILHWETNQQNRPMDLISETFTEQIVWTQ